MNKPNDISFSKNIYNYRDCLLELFGNFYEDNNQNYDLAISKLGMALMNPDFFPEFNTTLKKYGVKGRNALLIYIICKAVEINYYRKGANGINQGFNNIQILRDGKDEITVTPSVLKLLLNDALFHILSTNRLYEQDIIKTEIKTSLQKSIYKACPIIMMEHLNALLEEPSGKELILERIEEAMTIVFERIEYEANLQPTIRVHNNFRKKKQFLSDFNYRVFDQFNTREKETDEKDDKVMMCEMIYAALRKKETSGMSFGEYNLFSRLKKCNKTKQDLSEFYDSHSIEIMGFFISNMSSLNELKKIGILEDQPEFINAKNKI